MKTTLIVAVVLLVNLVVVFCRAASTSKYLWLVSLTSDTSNLFSCSNATLRSTFTKSSCKTTTVSGLIAKQNHHTRRFGKLFIFQAGTHIVDTVPSAKTKFLSLGYATELVLRGQLNSTIQCADASIKIEFTTSPNITINNLQFKDCKQILLKHMQKEIITAVINSLIVNSYLKFQYNSQANTTVTIKLQYTSVVHSSFMTEKSHDVVITAHGFNGTFVNVPFHVSSKPYGTIQLNGLHFRDCQDIELRVASTRNKTEMTVIYIANS